MSEYWVSRKKWTCKYCDVTINDDVPSRQQHENGLRHKGNVERSLRQAYKKSERDRRDESHAKREMEKIERLAQQSHAKDLAGASSSTSLASPPTTAASKEAKDPEKEEVAKSNKAPMAWKPTNRLAAYGSALPMNDGTANAEEEEVKLKEWQEKQELRRREGAAGEWETVAPSPSARIPAWKAERADSTDRDQAKAYKVREKQGHFRDDEDDEVGAQIKVKKRIKIQSEAEKLKQAEEDRRKMMPSWKPMRLDTGISAKEEDIQLVPVQESREEQQVDLATKEEEEADDVTAATVSKSTQQEPEVSATNPMFKKRKSGAGAGAKRVRAVI